MDYTKNIWVSLLDKVSNLKTFLTYWCWIEGSFHSLFSNFITYVSQLLPIVFFEFTVRCPSTFLLTKAFFRKVKVLSIDFYIKVRKSICWIILIRYQSKTSFYLLIVWLYSPASFHIIVFLIICKVSFLPSIIWYLLKIIFN